MSHADSALVTDRARAWPAFDFREFRPTCETLHRWIQIVGKIRLAQTPWQIHSWHATVYLSACGLTTSPIAYRGRSFQIDFDFVEHALRLRTDRGHSASIALLPQSVSVFHGRIRDALRSLDLDIDFHGAPNELADPTPFAEDHAHAAYDAEYVNRFWRVLLQADRVFKTFRTAFLGKASPVHLFWGSLDLAVTRFSGRPAPQHPGGIAHLPDRVTREAYSHEVSSAGFWAGGGPVDYPAFYSYAYPTPPEFADQPVRPDGAFFHRDAGEFLLPYEAVRQAPDPDAALLEFLHSTYVAAAETGDWDRGALECPLGRPRVTRPV